MKCLLALARSLSLMTGLGAAGLALAAPPDDAAAARGQLVYQRWCVACHGPGQHTPGTLALTFKYQGQRSPLLTQRPDITLPYLQVFVRQGISVMPFFRRTEISDDDLADIAAYLARSAAVE